MATLIEHRFEMNPDDFNLYLSMSCNGVDFCSKLQQCSGRDAVQHPLVGLVDRDNGIVVVYMIDCMPTKPLSARLPASFHTERIVGNISVPEFRDADDVSHLLSMVK